MNPIIKSLQDQLRAAGISLSGPRAHSAIKRCNDGAPVQECVETAVSHEKYARDLWLQAALDPWCKRHGLNRQQAISIAFFDHACDPDNPDKDLVTMKDLIWDGGQSNDFVMELRRQALAVPTDDELLEACLANGDEVAAEWLQAHPESVPAIIADDVGDLGDGELEPTLALAPCG